ncbi:MAG: hypothetical protein HYZ73_01405 [Elusimicrobia bacterium]|nr:hypothetical protein [Elusimicrobiota bacterium]
MRGSMALFLLVTLFSGSLSVAYAEGDGRPRVDYMVVCVSSNGPPEWLVARLTNEINKPTVMGDSAEPGETLGRPVAIDQPFLVSAPVFTMLDTSGFPRRACVTLTKVQ